LRIIHPAGVYVRCDAALMSLVSAVRPVWNAPPKKERLAVFSDLCIRVSNVPQAPQGGKELRIIHPAGVYVRCDAALMSLGSASA
jgi:hypothetical protein